MRNVLLLAVFMLALTGCASKDKAVKELIFFPPEPNPPRVQFLLGIGDSKDVEEKKESLSLVSLSAVRDDEVKSFVKPYGVAAQGSRIYVSDTITGKVAVIDLRLKRFDWLKGNFGPGQLKKPVNMSVDQEGTLYVVDAVRKKVLVYDQEGNFKRIYGEAFDMKPADVAVDARRLYVLDISRNKILVFDKQSGEMLEGLGQDAENPAERLALPTNMSLTERGIFFVSNIVSGSIIKMDRDGHVLASIGKMGDGFGQFGRPKGVATDSEERLYVVDSAHQNVQFFNPDGRLLMFFGDSGQSSGSLNVPASITVTNKDLDVFQTFADPGFELEQVVIVISQVGRDKVGIYGLGKKKGFDYDKFYQESEEIARKLEASRIEKEKTDESKK